MIHLLLIKYTEGNLLKNYVYFDFFLYLKKIQRIIYYVYVRVFRFVTDSDLHEI